MEKEQLKKIDKKLLRRLLKYARPYVSNFVFAIAIIVVIVLLELYQPILIGKAVDGFLSKYTNKSVITTEAEQSLHTAGIIKICFIYFLTPASIQPS